jgi:DNA polymerase III alpha subunit (gram-positive type)
MKFHEWWKDRAIPKTRHGAKSALQKLGYSSTNSALVNNLALSLSDCYWIQPRGEGLTWKDTNLFTNDFVDTLRIARKYIKDIDHHKLDDLTDYYGIRARTKHRALNDCDLTNRVYKKMCKSICNEFENFDEFKKLFK